MNQGMLKKLNKIQDELKEAQQKIDMSEFTGKATGVTVIMQGTRQVLDVQISMELLTDLECLQDSILLATNDCLTQIEKAHEETMGSLSLGIPGFGF